MGVYRLLDLPFVYRVVQWIMAPGGEKAFTAHLCRLANELPRVKIIIDVGCGPASLLWRIGRHPIGIDVSSQYTTAFRAHGEVAVTASATHLPLPDRYIDAAWTIGMLHHLPDVEARAAIVELVRVTRADGYVVIFDGLMPESPWPRPLIWLQRRLDRGRFVREERRLRELLPEPHTWRCERVSYSLIGHEGLFCFRGAI
jgi:ubiquinone/menaquinone biosynthesis C-methylase UbiE